METVLPRALSRENGALETSLVEWKRNNALSRGGENHPWKLP